MARNNASASHRIVRDRPSRNGRANAGGKPGKAAKQWTCHDLQRRNDFRVRRWKTRRNAEKCALLLMSPLHDAAKFVRCEDERRFSRAYSASNVCEES